MTRRIARQSRHKPTLLGKPSAHFKLFELSLGSFGARSSLFGRVKSCGNTRGFNALLIKAPQRSNHIIRGWYLHCNSFGTSGMGRAHKLCGYLLCNKHWLLMSSILIFFCGYEYFFLFHPSLVISRRVDVCNTQVLSYICDVETIKMLDRRGKIKTPTVEFGKLRNEK